MPAHDTEQGLQLYSTSHFCLHNHTHSVGAHAALKHRNASGPEAYLLAQKKNCSPFPHGSQSCVLNPEPALLVKPHTAGLRFLGLSPQVSGSWPVVSQKVVLFLDSNRALLSNDCWQKGFRGNLPVGFAHYVKMPKDDASEVLVTDAVNTAAF